MPLLDLVSELATGGREVQVSPLLAQIKVKSEHHPSILRSTSLASSKIGKCTWLASGWIVATARLRELA